LKRILALGLTALFLTIPVFALAEEAVNLTPEQSREITEINKQIMELKKKKIDKCVEYGRLTKENGDQMKAKIDGKMGEIERNPGRLCPKPNND